MNSKKFAVIFLPSEKIYSEVPVSWITDNETQCWWPKSVNATSYMVRGEPPNKETWELHDIEIETFCSTLEGARRRAEDPSYLTANEDFEETGRGRRKKKNVVLSSSEESITPPPSISDKLTKIQKSSAPKTISSNKETGYTTREKKNISHSSSEESITPPPSVSGKPYKLKIPSTSKGKKIITYIDHIRETGSSEQIVMPPMSLSVSEAQECQVILTEAQDNDIENMPIIIAENGTVENLPMDNLHHSIERLTRICLDMQKNIQSLQKNIKSLHTRNGNLEVDRYMKNLQDKLPLKCLDELVPFDTHISIEENKHSFISYMKSVGGRDLKDNINRCLGLIYTNNLSRSCSLKGKRGNFKLGETYTMKLFIDIMVSHHKTSISDVQAYIGEWFRLGKQRYLRENNIDK